MGLGIRATRIAVAHAAVASQAAFTVTIVPLEDLFELHQRKQRSGTVIERALHVCCVSHVMQLPHSRVIDHRPLESCKYSAMIPIRIALIGVF